MIDGDHPVRSRGPPGGAQGAGAPRPHPPWRYGGILRGRREALDDLRAARSGSARPRPRPPSRSPGRRPGVGRAARRRRRPCDRPRNEASPGLGRAGAAPRGRRPARMGAMPRGARLTHLAGAGRLEACDAADAATGTRRLPGPPPHAQSPRRRRAAFPPEAAPGRRRPDRVEFDVGMESPAAEAVLEAERRRAGRSIIGRLPSSGARRRRRGGAWGGPDDRLGPSDAPLRRRGRSSTAGAESVPGRRPRPRPGARSPGRRPETGAQPRHAGRSGSAGRRFTIAAARRHDPCGPSHRPTTSTAAEVHLRRTGPTALLQQIPARSSSAFAGGTRWIRTPPGGCGPPIPAPRDSSATTCGAGDGGSTNDVRRRRDRRIDGRIVRMLRPDGPGVGEAGSRDRSGLPTWSRGIRPSARGS